MVSQVVGDVYSAGNTTTTGTNLQFPTGIEAGDDLWIFGLFAGIGNSAEAGGFTVPAGFAVHGSDHVYNATMAVRTWRKTATGTETGAATCTWGGGSSASRTAWIVLAVPAANRTAGLIGVSFANAANGTTPSVDAPGIAASGTATGYTVAFERSSSPSTAYSAIPAGTTLLDSMFGTGSGACSAGLARYDNPDADGTFGGGTWTTNAANNAGRVAATVAYNVPAPSNPEVTGTGTVTLTGTGFIPRPVDLVVYPAYGAHRGGANTGGRPENVVYSFEQSILQDHPATILEFDLYQLGEGGGATPAERLALTHAGNDLTAGSQIREADGTTVVSGTALSKTVAQWDTYRVFPRSGISGSDRPASRWPAMLQLLLDNPTKIGMVETKDAASVAPIIESLTANGLLGRVMGQSFDWDRCVAMANAGIFTVYLVSQFSTRSAADIAAAGIKGVGIDRTDPSGVGIASYCTQAHAAGLVVWAYTVNSTSLRDTLLSQGVDAFYTDVPRVVNRSMTLGEATGTGTVALTGSVTAIEREATTGTGTVAVAGTTSALELEYAAGTGSLTVTGSATALASYAVTGTGTAALTGAAATSTIETRTGTSSTALAGTGVIVEREVVTGTAALTVTGFADAQASGGTPSRTGTGSVVVTGSAPAAEREIISAAGSTTLTGAATAAVVVIGTGGVLLAGTAVTAGTQTATGAGSVTIAGGAVVSVRETRTGLAELDLAGTAALVEREYVTGLAAVALTGSAATGLVVATTGSGLVQLAGSAAVQVVTADDGRPVAHPVLRLTTRHGRLILTTPQPTLTLTGGT